MARIDWCTKHLNSSNFYYVFFADECTFYLNYPPESKWIKIDEDNIIYSKNKEIKLCICAGISNQGKTLLFLYEDNIELS